MEVVELEIVFWVLRDDNVLGTTKLRTNKEFLPKVSNVLNFGVNPTWKIAHLNHICRKFWKSILIISSLPFIWNHATAVNSQEWVFKKINVREPVENIIY